jgi:hypothetical protein
MTTAPFPDEDTLRETALALADEACNGDDGRLLGDPVFHDVTEGRARWPGYFSCGDLPHWMLAQMGFQNEKIVNRNDDGGVVPWKVGANLSRLVFGTGKAFVWARKDLRPKPGDVLYVLPPEHVCVLESIDEKAGTITTFDYGQWDAKKGKPKGSRRVSTFRSSGSQLLVGKRVLRGWLDLSRLPGILEEST